MTSLRPARLGLGGASLGNMYTAVDDRTAELTMSAGWDGGVRHFDTAPVYGNGLGELRLGHFLRQHPREAYEVSTKVGRLVRASFTPDRSRAAAPRGPGAGATSVFVDVLSARVDVDYGYDAAMRSVEDSLSRLGLDRLDAAYVHDLGSDHLGAEWEEHFTVAETGAFRALARLRDQHVVGAWGLGTNVLEPQLRALERADPDVVHVSGRYTLLDQSAAADLLPRARERGVPVVLGGPYNSGLLAGRDRYDYHPATAERREARDRLRALATRHGVDLRAAALQFAAAHEAVTHVLVGTQSPRHAAENARLMTARIPADFWDELERAGHIFTDAPVPEVA